MERVDTFGVCPPFLGDCEAIVDPDALDHENAIVGFDLAGGVDLVALGIDFDVTRLQRAGERARESPAGCRDDVIERRGVGRKSRWVDAVVLGNLGVNPE
jgi:hypothetical protein